MRLAGLCFTQTRPNMPEMGPHGVSSAQPIKREARWNRSRWATHSLPSSPGERGTSGTGAMKRRQRRPPRWSGVSPLHRSSGPPRFARSHGGPGQRRSGCGGATCDATGEEQGDPPPWARAYEYYHSDAHSSEPQGGLGTAAVLSLSHSVTRSRGLRKCPSAFFGEKRARVAPGTRLVWRSRLERGCDWTDS